jgi:hypothetical protein
MLNKQNKSSLIDAVIETVKDERLSSGWHVAKDLPEEDLKELCKLSTDPEYFFVRKALEAKVGPQLAESVSDMLVIRKAANE